MSAQVKIERDILAEMAFTGNDKFCDLDFYLEDERRDLTVRMRGQDDNRGALVDWIEAKMCYTDCLARKLTERGDREDYMKQMCADAQKQALALPRAKDRGTLRTLLLFAIHRDRPLPRQKYYPGFRNRKRRDGSPITGDAILEAAREHVNEIASFINRDVVEKFMIPLDPTCQLHVFAFRAPNVRPA